MGKKYDGGLKFIRQGEAEIYYDSFGDCSNTPLILISGLYAQLTHWSEQFCKFLAKKGFYVIRFDQRDVGLSSPCPPERAPNGFTLYDIAEDTVELMNALSIKKAVIVGKSTGGIVGQILAGKYPERVISLVTISSSTNSAKLKKPNKEIMDKMKQYPPNPLKSLKEYMEHKVDFVRSIYGSKYDFDEKFHKEMAISESLRNGNNSDGFKRHMDSLKKTGDISQITKTIKCPTIIIHGDEDPLVGVDAAIDLNKKIPNSTLIVYEGMGHYFPKELHKKVAKKIAKQKIK